MTGTIKTRIKLAQASRFSQNAAEEIAFQVQQTAAAKGEGDQGHDQAKGDDSRR